jgi:hypothetical protein
MVGACSNRASLSVLLIGLVNASMVVTIADKD